MERGRNDFSIALPSLSLIKDKAAVANKRPSEIGHACFLVVLGIDKEVFCVLGISNEDESFVA